MIRREKWLKKVPDRYIEATICDASRHLKGDCPNCPIKKLCRDNDFGSVNEYEKYMTAVSKWLDEEEEDAISEEDALKLIDSLVSINGTLKREIIMSDAIMSIGKEASND